MWSARGKFLFCDHVPIIDDNLNFGGNYVAKLYLASTIVLEAMLVLNREVTSLGSCQYPPHLAYFCVFLLWTAGRGNPLKLLLSEKILGKACRFYLALLSCGCTCESSHFPQMKLLHYRYFFYTTCACVVAGTNYFHWKRSFNTCSESFSLKLRNLWFSLTWLHNLWRKVLKGRCILNGWNDYDIQAYTQGHWAWSLLNDPHSTTGAWSYTELTFAS